MPVSRLNGLARNANNYGQWDQRAYQISISATNAWFHRQFVDRKYRVKWCSADIPDNKCNEDGSVLIPNKK